MNPLRCHRTGGDSGRSPVEGGCVAPYETLTGPGSDSGVLRSQVAVRPPSTTKAAPVANEDSSEARYTIIEAISSGRPSRFSG